MGVSPFPDFDHSQDTITGGRHMLPPSVSYALGYRRILLNVSATQQANKLLKKHNISAVIAELV
jgi:hypothetical protein